MQAIFYERHNSILIATAESRQIAVPRDPISAEAGSANPAKHKPSVNKLLKITVPLLCGVSVESSA